PPGVAPSGQQILIRVSRTTAKAGILIYNHETWLLRLDGSENKLFIPSSFNAVWKPKTRFTAASGAFYNVWKLADNAVATGQVAVGKDSFQAAAPAAVPVTGDGANNPAPTYATFATLGAGTDAGKAADRTGQPVSQTLALDGTLGEDAGLGAGVQDAHFVPE